jgi:hypothetical protein
MSLESGAAGAATSGDSDVVRTSAAIVANATARGAEEINPLLINIVSSSDHLSQTYTSRGVLKLIEVNRV